MIMQSEKIVVYFITTFQNLSAEYQKNYDNSMLIEEDNKNNIDNCP
jgi:hypothetical protein